MVGLLKESQYFRTIENILHFWTNDNFKFGLTTTSKVIGLLPFKKFGLTTTCQTRALI